MLFNVCKSYLNLSKECNFLSYDAMTAHTAVVFTRYMMLLLESRESNDNRSLGGLFLYFSDEMSDITCIQAFQMLLQQKNSKKEILIFYMLSIGGSGDFYVNKIFEKIVIVCNEIVKIDNR